MCWNRVVTGPRRSALVFPALHDVLSNRVFQRFARRESHDATLWDLDRRAGLRVAGRARLALRGFERAEADEGDWFTFLERLGDSCDQRFDGRRGASLRRTS